MQRQRRMRGGDKEEGRKEEPQTIHDAPRHGAMEDPDPMPVLNDELSQSDGNAATPPLPPPPPPPAAAAAATSGLVGDGVGC